MLGLALILGSCNLEQEITIDLPGYQSNIVVECYLEPGRPFGLLLSRSAAYFDPFPPIDNEFLQKVLVNNARVVIRHGNSTFELKNELSIDPDQQKVFNYTNSNLVPEDYDEGFSLEIILEEGDTLWAETRLLPPVPIDSIVVEFSETTDTLARVLTYFTDDPQVENYYRRLLNNSSLDSVPAQDFVIDDRFVEKTVVFGTGFDYSTGDTIINTIFHLDRTYFRFLQSLGDAVNANGNPFAQPSPIISNIEGTTEALGIFTGVSYDRQTTVIEK